MTAQGRSYKAIATLLVLQVVSLALPAAASTATPAAGPGAAPGPSAVPWALPGAPEPRVASSASSPSSSPSSTPLEQRRLVRLLQAAKRYRPRHGTGSTAAATAATAGDSGGGASNDGGGGDGGVLPPMLRQRHIQRATYLGDTERIRSFVRRMALGEPLTIALLGGSVSKGMGAVPGEHSFEEWLAAWLAAVAPAAAAPPAASTATGEVAGGEGGAAAAAAGRYSNASSVRIINAACPATSSAYMNMCLGEYLREGPQVDLVLLEYSINDDPFPDPPWENESRKSFELLLRKLLSLPRRPAVVLLCTYRWRSEVALPGAARRDSLGLYYTNTEGDYFTFATYYGVPLLSLKAAVYHQMTAGARGFQVHSMRYQERDNASSDPAALFYEDPMHPSGLTGHRAISELIAGLFTQVARGMLMRPWRQAEAELAAAPLPRHMIPGNADSALDRCLLGEAFRDAALETEGFDWVNEGRNPRAPKWGFTATAPGATITFNLSAVAYAGAGAASASATALAAAAAAAATEATAEADAAGPLALVILAYLRSYEHMGVAAVRCEGGCVCGQAALRGRAAAAAAEGTGAGAVGPSAVVTELDGHWGERTSQLQLGCFLVRLPPPPTDPRVVLGGDGGDGGGGGGGCMVRVTVAERSSSGEHKVKLGGLMLSHTSPELAADMCRDNMEAAQRAAGYRER